MGMDHLGKKEETMSEIRPIGQKSRNIADLMLAIKTQAWIFEKWHEKLMIVAALVWGMYSIARWLFFLIF